MCIYDNTLSSYFDNALYTLHSVTKYSKCSYMVFELTQVFWDEMGLIQKPYKYIFHILKPSDNFETEGPSYTQKFLFI